jgi:hypothetical protein
MGRNQGVMEEFITDSVRKWFQGFRAIATDEIVIPLVNENDARTLERIGQEPLLRASPQQIQGEYLFKMELGSSRPTNEMQEKQEALLMLNAAKDFGEAVMLPQFLIDWLVAFNKSPRRYLLNQGERNVMGAAIPGQAGNGAGGQQRQSTPIDPNLLRGIQ